MLRHLLGVYLHAAPSVGGFEDHAPDYNLVRGAACMCGEVLCHGRG